TDGLRRTERRISSQGRCEMPHGYATGRRTGDLEFTTAAWDNSRYERRTEHSELWVRLGLALPGRLHPARPAPPRRRAARRALQRAEGDGGTFPAPPSNPPLEGRPRGGARRP